MSVRRKGTLPTNTTVATVAIPHARRRFTSAEDETPISEENFSDSVHVFSSWRVAFPLLKYALPLLREEQNSTQELQELTTRRRNLTNVKC